MTTLAPRRPGSSGSVAASPAPSRFDGVLDWRALGLTDPGDRTALEARCHLLFEYGPPAEAVAAWQQVLRLAPDDAPARAELARAARPERRAVTL